MSSSRNASDFSRIGLNALAGANAIGPDDLIPLDQPMSEEQLRQRAKLIGTILEMRKRVQTLRDRADALNGALESFRDRQDQIQRRA
ncbi:MAG TPA: hypothetical protein PK001_06540 [Dokdonella sp.]|uniref:hypothetical protein n=1 Tax=Dokdonella sp. TaxID=2291710 RepID=UPI002C9885CF|nr:hypothetical protein [Dokdonella sp.]HOX71385.1 hypothetical protein [Dokdonella sp.]